MSKSYSSFFYCTRGVKFNVIVHALVRLGRLRNTTIRTFSCFKPTVIGGCLEAASDLEREVPKNFKLMAVPLFELYDKTQ
eukprot:gene26724-32835_t